MVFVREKKCVRVEKLDFYNAKFFNIMIINTFHARRHIYNAIKEKYHDALRDDVFLDCVETDTIIEFFFLLKTRQTIGYRRTSNAFDGKSTAS